ncbi:MAG: hypothetical protein E6R03_17620 [Hyphomicrobiaceae bacterium]|nr:MAG: hypothetical protein E6R03_17620 [Hyphomicrobiaceae bacterium]
MAAKPLTQAEIQALRTNPLQTVVARQQQANAANLPNLTPAQVRANPYGAVMGFAQREVERGNVDFAEQVGYQQEIEAYRRALGDDLTAEDEALLERLRQQGLQNELLYGTSRARNGWGAGSEERDKLKERLSSLQETRRTEAELGAAGKADQINLKQQLQVDEFANALAQRINEYQAQQNKQITDAYGSQRQALGVRGYNPATVRANVESQRGALRGTTSSYDGIRADARRSILDFSIANRANQQQTQLQEQGSEFNRRLALLQEANERALQERAYAASQKLGDAEDRAKLYSMISNTVSSIGSGVGKGLAG